MEANVAGRGDKESVKELTFGQGVNFRRNIQKPTGDWRSS